jgi:nicotinamide-nucleotide amidase
VIVVGDDPAELEAALRDGSTSTDLCLVSGGLGPTHDDRTVELVARVAGRALRLDADLEATIASVSRTFAERLGRPYADFAAGVAKQATVPEGASILGIAGTAPGLVLQAGPCVFVVLPGPPGELKRLWPRVLETPEVRAVLARAVVPTRRVQRFYGASESAVAKALADAGGDGDGVEVTICARDFEIHVDYLVAPGAEPRADTISDALGSALKGQLFSWDERSVQELVIDACRTRGLTLATAESCTGGLIAGRLTDVAGASDVFVGGVVAYANDVKQSALDVPGALIATHGAVSAEVAVAMAEGARSRLGADVAVSVTGIAGPDGGTDEKPVGLVHLHAVGPDGSLAREFVLPGQREWIRARAAVAGLHLVRALLTQS